MLRAVYSKCQKESFCCHHVVRPKLPVQHLTGSQHHKDSSLTLTFDERAIHSGKYRHYTQFYTRKPWPWAPFNGIWLRRRRLLLSRFLWRSCRGLLAASFFFLLAHKNSCQGLLDHYRSRFLRTLKSTFPNLAHEALFPLLPTILNSDCDSDQLTCVLAFYSLC